MKNTAQFRINRSQGFTLVELLVVITIIAILAIVVTLIIDPIELTRRGRDSQRLAAMTSLNQAINVAVQEATQSGSQILCSGGIAVPCSGKSTDNNVNVRKNDGTGWVKVDLSAQKSISVPVLPSDPVNNASQGFEYSYGTNNAGDKWEINAKLESKQLSGNMTTDGGDNNTLYEIGSDLTIMN